MSEPDDLQPWVAQAVRAEIGARHTNIRQVGIAAGIPDKVLRRALDCERPTTLSQLSRIAHALNVTVTYLMVEAERRRAAVDPEKRAIVEGSNIPASEKRRLLTETDDDPVPDSGDTSDRQGGVRYRSAQNDGR